MALKFILGPSGSGKSSLLFRTALKHAQDHPDRRYIVLVPEQYTMQTQRQLTSLSSRRGILNIDVLSFTRLSYRVFEQTGLERREVLSETGKVLLLRLIASRERERLPLLSRSVDKSGVLSEVKSVLSELDEYGIGSEDLYDIACDVSEKRARPSLANKLLEIANIQDAFIKYQADRFITGEKLLSVLCGKAPLDSTLRGCEFFLDGYTGFTPSQLDVIRELLPIASDITVTLTADPSEEGIFCERDLRLFGVGAENDYSLFSLTRKTISALIHASYDTGVMVEEPVILDGSGGRFKNRSALSYLEKNLLRRGRKVPYRGRNTEIFFRECSDPYDEVASAASTIRKKTMEGLHYRDIAIVCADLKEYAEYAKRVLTLYKIPHFIDQLSAATLNPALEFVEGSIAVFASGFSYESIMRIVRTSFAMEGSRDDWDILDNYLIATGIRGYTAWSVPFTRQTRHNDTELLETSERLRASFMEKFAPFSDVMKKEKAKVRDYARAVWEMISRFQVQEKLMQMSNGLWESGDRVRSSEYAQVTGVIVDVLDEAAGLIGDETITRTQFAEILRAGFSEAKIGTVPPGIDEVHVGDMERTRLDAVKVLIFLGMNDNFVPRRGGGGGILTDMEREYLSLRGVHLSPTAREEATIQQFYLYLTLTKPSDELILSWSLTSRGGEQRKMSYLIEEVRELFPDIKELVPSSSDPWQDVADRKTALTVLAAKLREYQEINGEESSRRERELKEFLKLYLKDEWKDKALTLLNGAQGGKESSLNESCARSLYGNVLVGSVSRLEEFARCPFWHYADFGLRLKEREEFRISPLQTGSVLHAAIEEFCRRVHDNSTYNWTTLPDGLRDTWAQECITNAALSQTEGMYTDTCRRSSIAERLRKIMARTTRTLQEQIRFGMFVPSLFEVKFGYGKDTPALLMEIPGRGRMELRGRIDRIDLSDDADKKTLYVKIVDYKSGIKRLDPDRFIDGEQLQLIAYIDASSRIVEAEYPDRKIICGGAFYYSFQDPVLDEADLCSDQAGKIEGTAGKIEGQAGKIEDSILRKMKVTGLLNRDREVLRRLDRTLEGDGASLVVNVRMAKGEVDGRYSNAMSGEQIDILRRYCLERMRGIASEILGGVILPHPSFRGAGDNACMYCPYGDVCRFDPERRGMDYNLRHSRSGEERWDIMNSALRNEQL